MHRRVDGLSLPPVEKLPIENIAKAAMDLSRRLYDEDHSNVNIFLKTVGVIAGLVNNNRRLCVALDRAGRLSDDHTKKEIVFGKIDLNTLRGGRGPPRIGSHSGWNHTRVHVTSRIKRLGVPPPLVVTE